MRPFYLFRRNKIISSFQFNSPRPQNSVKKTNRNDNNDLVNERIRFPEVLVIGPEGEQLGKMSRYDAMRKAEEYDLDLLCVAPAAHPPVCKIINYGKYRFQAQKKAKEAKKNQKVIEVKEVQLTPQISDHDIETKAKAAIKFLQDGNKVKVGVRYRGRQLAHPEVGEESLNKFMNYVKDIATVDTPPIMEGRRLSCLLASKIKK